MDNKNILDLSTLPQGEKVVVEVQEKNDNLSNKYIKFKDLYMFKDNHHESILTNIQFLKDIPPEFNYKFKYLIDDQYTFKWINNSLIIRKIKKSKTITKLIASNYNTVKSYYVPYNKILTHVLLSQDKLFVLSDQLKEHPNSYINIISKYHLFIISNDEIDLPTSNTRLKITLDYLHIKYTGFARYKKVSYYLNKDNNFEPIRKGVVQQFVNKEGVIQDAQNQIKL
jgi:hypothetical protein